MSTLEIDISYHSLIPNQIHSLNHTLAISKISISYRGEFFKSFYWSMLLLIQLYQCETRSYPSGKPRAHGIFQLTIPMTEPAAVKGPPESPWQMPCPAWVKVQILLSRTKWAFVPIRIAQSALVIVCLVIHCKLFGAGPPLTEVPPHPETTDVTPPPINSLPTRIGATLAVQTNGWTTRTTQTSWAIKAELYSGWLIILSTSCNWGLTPPLRRTVPATTRV